MISIKSTVDLVICLLRFIVILGLVDCCIHKDEVGDSIHDIEIELGLSIKIL